MSKFSSNRRPRDQSTALTRAAYAFLAGLLGITVNTAMLKLAPLIHIDPGSGGLLKLLLRYATRWAPWSLAALHRVGVEKPPTLFAFLWFHYLTGMFMILFYFYVVSRYLPGPWWRKATISAVLLWIVNAAFVLPQLGQGFAGIHKIPASGILYFFAANWLLFVVSALAFDHWFPSEDSAI